MSLFRSVKGGRWSEPFGSDGGFRAVLLGDFRVDQNGISVWNEGSDLAARIVASNLQEIDTITLLEIPQLILDDLGIAVTASVGRAPDPAARKAHRNLACYSGALLTALLARLCQGPRLQEYGPERVRKLLQETLEAGALLKRLKPLVVRDLLRNSDISRADGHRVLTEHFRKDPCLIRRFNLEEVEELIDSNCIAVQTATMFHPSV